MSGLEPPKSDPSDSTALISAQLKVASEIRLGAGHKSEPAHCFFGRCPSAMCSDLQLLDSSWHGLQAVAGYLRNAHLLNRSLPFRTLEALTSWSVNAEAQPWLDTSKAAYSHLQASFMSASGRRAF